MKKIAALILVSVLMLATTISVSAKTTHDSHYDFYGKAGPTIEKISIVKNTAEMPTVAIVTLKNQAIAPDPGDNQVIKEITNITESTEAEATNFSYNLQRPERPTSDYWPDVDYGLTDRLKEITLPPGYRHIIPNLNPVPLE